MGIKRTGYQIIIQQRDKAGILEKGYNSVIFYNLGAANLLIGNNLPIPTNGTFAITGEENEVCDTDITFSFAAGGTQNVVIVRKVFSDR